MPQHSTKIDMIFNENYLGTKWDDARYKSYTWNCHHLFQQAAADAKRIEGFCNLGKILRCRTAILRSAIN